MDVVQVPRMAPLAVLLERRQPPGAKDDSHQPKMAEFRRFWNGLLSLRTAFT
jgi:hypothetical protein